MAVLQEETWTNFDLDSQFWNQDPIEMIPDFPNETNGYAVNDAGTLDEVITPSKMMRILRSIQCDSDS